MENEEQENEPGQEDVTAPDPAGPFHYLGKRIAGNRAELRAWMDAGNYFPNVWFISDHGNAHLLVDVHDASKD